MSDWLETVRDRLAADGIDESGVASAEGWPGWLDGARSVVVFASGGAALWDAFADWARAHPLRFAARPHPLDAFVRDRVRAADPRAGPDRRWVLSGSLSRRQPDFRRLAFEAGLGHRSRLDLLLHPTRGTWLGLRAACFTSEPLTPTGPLDGPGPCDACDAPCQQACPAGAISSAGWDVPRCVAFHEAADDCAATCHARDACPVGQEHRYPALERLYHMDRRAGRRALARSLGIPVGFPGVGPVYRAWGRPRRRLVR